MSRSILSLRLYKRQPFPLLGPGWRKINGRWYYSAAWLDSKRKR